MTQRIAIIGGGPAGLYAAWLLASKGIACTVFDHRIPWEKPCGGGITSKAFDQFGFLADCRADAQIVTDFVFLSPNDKRAALSGAASLSILSRKRLSEFMLDKCRAVGVRHIAEKITSMRKDGSTFTLEADTAHGGFDFVIGADGAHGVSRNLFGAEPFNKNRFAGMGYFVEGLTDKTVVLKSYRDFKGYLWMFPRLDHASVGIGFTSGTCTKAEAFQKVKDFLAQHYPGFEADENRTYAATIPFATDWKRENLQGEGWALVGDAGGFTDAITGEGIYYAFKSADLLAEAVLKGKAESYFETTLPIRKELEMAYRISDRFYAPRTLEWLVKVCRRSGFMRKLIADMILGYHPYGTLKATLKRNKWKIMAQLAWGSLFPQRKPVIRAERKPAA